MCTPVPCRWERAVYNHYQISYQSIDSSTAKITAGKDSIRVK